MEFLWSDMHFWVSSTRDIVDANVDDNDDTGQTIQDYTGSLVIGNLCHMSQKGPKLSIQVPIEKKDYV